jgi:GT2 family glycosyltransferase
LILVYHKNNRISRVISEDKTELLFDKKATIAEGLSELALQFPKSKIAWCKESFQEILNIKEMESLFHHDKMMLSYNPSAFNYLGKKIGYIEESPFIKVNKKVTFPTWQMSSAVGVVHASLLLIINNKIKKDTDFDYYLNSVAKKCMPLGLMCYSEPRLLLDFDLRETFKEATIYTFFRFVKQHYKTRWVLIMAFNLMVYEKKTHFLAAIYAVFFNNRIKSIVNLDAISLNSSLKVVDETTIDVVIPTIGRKNQLYNVLCDLRKQTHLPQNIIIVEQNPFETSQSELDYLQNEQWPFIIKHTFTHQAGACNARNIALKQTQSEWVFLADDDIRISELFFQKALENIKKIGFKSVSFSCLRIDEKQVYKKIIQWGSFGSGCSIVSKKSLNDCNFNIGFEFGYGEDSDFGMQLRNQGADILYLPEPSILHLKAPIGGFRTKPPLQWQEDNVQPKPSPTVMLFQIIHNTQEQIRGYKTILFFKYYKHQKIKNPIAYFINFQKQWDKSVFWANQLKKQNEV